MRTDSLQLVTSSDAAEAAPAPPTRDRQARRAAADQPLVQAPAPSVASNPAEHSLNVRVDQHRRVYYEVINDRTGEVVRQIPPEEIRRVSESISEMLQAAQASKSVDVRS